MSATCTVWTAMWPSWCHLCQHQCMLAGCTHKVHNASQTARLAGRKRYSHSHTRCSSQWHSVPTENDCTCKKEELQLRQRAHRCTTAGSKLATTRSSAAIQLTARFTVAVNTSPQISENLCKGRGKGSGAHSCTVAAPMASAMRLRPVVQTAPHLADRKHHSYSQFESGNR